MAMFDTFDRTGAVEFPFSSEVVFRAATEAVRRLRGMDIVEENKLAKHLSIRTSMSAFSWGEKVSLSVQDAAPGKSRMAIQSGAKTILGSATTHGRNRKNVEAIISTTSDILERSGQDWTSELAPIAPPAGGGEGSTIQERLTKLTDLRERGLITDHDFEERKKSILDEI